MLIDRPQVSEGSVIVNATVPSGTSFPSLPNVGELFFHTGLGSLQSYDGSAWFEPGAAALTTHINDQSLHLTSIQNTLLDGLNAALTSAELNFVHGVTAPIQTQISAISDPTTGTLATHIADDARHLTTAENALIDAITVSAADLNATAGFGSNTPLQSQINTINTLDTAQNTRLTTLENTTVPAVQTNLTNHIADLSLHLTSSQNTLLDGITVPFADVNKLAGASGLTSSIKASLDQLAGSDYSAKISASGSIGMTGNLNFSGGKTVTGLPTPTNPGDAATKDYVDSFVQGLHWVGSVKAASVGNLILSGLQTIDGVALTINDRVLVKDQGTPADNGIYLMASGAWTRANDFNAVIEANNSAVFVLAGGTTQGKSTWVQTNTVTTLGTDPLLFSAFSGPVVNQAGGGITLGSNGMVSVKEGAGLGYDGNGALIADLYSSGGLMLTVNGTSAAPLTTAAAQIALTTTGVTSGSYGSATQAPTITVDANGRITAASLTTVSPAFSSITSKPTTLVGYGITDAVLKTGDTMSGNLTVALASGSTAITSQRATGAAGSAAFNLGTVGGAQAGTWQLYNPSGSSNFNIYSSVLGNDVMQMTTAGATNFTGSVQSATFISTNQSNFTGNQTGGMGNATGALGGIMVQSAGASGAAFMCFHRPGSFAAYFGLDTDNVWKVGGWSMGANAYPILHTANYNNYAPTLTGGNASGTWGINITGGAATATSATNAVNATNATNATLAAKASTLSQGGGNGAAMTFNWSGQGGQPTWLWGGTDGVNHYVYNPSNFSVNYATSAGNSATTSQRVFDRVNTSGINAGSYGSISISGTTNSYAGINFPDVNATFMIESAVSGMYRPGVGWDWYWTNGVLTQGTVPAGNISGTVASAATCTGNAATVTQNAYSGGGTYPVNWQSGSTYYTSTVTITPNTGTLSASALYASGDITAFSDARVKTDVTVIEDALAKIEQVRGVTFTRTDEAHSGLRQAGVIAQEVQVVLPEVVKTDDAGMLSVNYGAMSALLIEAIKALNKQVTDLQAEVKALKEAK